MNKITCICLGVKDMERSIKFYRDGLGYNTAALKKTIPAVINTGILNKMPARMKNHETPEPKFATGTNTVRMDNGTYELACCITCPHSCAATAIAATELLPYTESESPICFVLGL